ncbi:MAG TPA: NDP-sugar synthase [archaeon]|nr:NDP-sugar synthase [archaeon]
MQIVIPVGFRENFPVTKTPQTFLNLTSRELFSSILEKLRGHELIVVTPFPKLFKKYEVQVVKDEGSGSASCLKAVEKIITGPFILHYSDIFTPFKPEPLMKFHEEKGAMISAALTITPSPWRYGVISTDPNGRVVRFLYKPRPDLIFSNKVASGIFAMDPEVFDKIPYKMRMHELVSYFVHMDASVYGYEFKPFWYSLSSTEEYVDANNDFLNRRMELTQENVSGVNVFPPAHLRDIKAKTAILGPHVTANDVKMGRNVKIVNSVILEGVRLHDDVNISDSVIGPKVVIEKGAVVTDSLIGQGSRVGPGAKVGKSTVGVDKEVMENVFEMTLI